MSLMTKQLASATTAALRCTCDILPSCESEAQHSTAIRPERGGGVTHNVDIEPAVHEKCEELLRFAIRNWREAFYHRLEAKSKQSAHRHMSQLGSDRIDHDCSPTLQEWAALEEPAVLLCGKYLALQVSPVTRAWELKKSRQYKTAASLGDLGIRLGCCLNQYNVLDLPKQKTADRKSVV